MTSVFTLEPASSLPSLVFIPGAWHQASCYDAIITLLSTEHSLRCLRVTLPSTLDNPQADFKDDLDAARSVVLTEVNAGRDVVVIAHSYGGIVGGSVIKGLAASAPGQSSIARGCVSALVLIASGFALTGVSFMAPLFNRPPPAWRINRQTGYAQLVADPHSLFYHDVPLSESSRCVARLTSQSLKALFEGGEHVYSGWRDVPAWYIGTVQDQGLPVIVQRMQVGMARAMGGRVAHRELDSSHSPFISQPREVVDIIVEAVVCSSSTRHSLEGQARVQAAQACARGNMRITIPAVLLSAPSTWFRYGLPLAAGYSIGWLVQAYNWLRRNPHKAD